jgi:hypothetical protein
MNERNFQIALRVSLSHATGTSVRHERRRRNDWQFPQRSTDPRSFQIHVRFLTAAATHPRADTASTIGYEIAGDG